DIHIEPGERHARIRLRIDGMLITRWELEIERVAPLVNKIKILAGLDIAEKRLPQDGRFSSQLRGEKIDLRISTIPVKHGEKTVLRVLSRNLQALELDHIGLVDEKLKAFKRAISMPHGLVLVSGPTGSGKSTTLYAALMAINSPTRNIVSVEDPIEYSIAGVNQVQLRENVGLTFPMALRSFLRQDPDVIMVGEIRDEATAMVAVKAALTGHLVLSTIHTNSAQETTTRLVDMGVPKFLVENTLNLALAQRLVKCLCEKCKAPSSNIPEELKSMIQNGDSIYSAIGCSDCYETGFSGRIAIFEIYDPHNPNPSSCLAEEALTLLKKGQSTWEEVRPFLSLTHAI
ncbi:MAG: type II/IV secretion system protein, partial [Flavobacteriales bacterium]|nr:type II/IV secretion system protein [Flavobacteriales bacterium]